ncbi:glucosylceramidase [Deinococcus malanensis]|uniref:Glucosylceramidase n=1 Tax=Deinococcus malanensis TaxID=1706855 RepID=A0ABQ2F1X6_9DEIO|nr:glycoside hydrolase family 30 beta sandwich domain-containing protein [Deinococcus malanensis]GGK41692.1 glucosylceramidase [Deinococcus malanensis]
MNLKTNLLFASIVLALTACSQSLPQVPALGDPLVQAARTTQTTRTAQIWLTTPDGRQKIAAQPGVAFKSGVTPVSGAVTVDPKVTYQSIKGFGAALTESSAYLMTDKMSGTQRSALLRQLFDPAGGIGLSYVRIPLGASDFARSSYTYHDLPAGVVDESLTSFSLARDEQYVLPLARDIRATSPEVRFMGTPWSAPAWMKDTAHLNGGQLLPEWRSAYSNYLLRAVQGYAQSGVPLDMLTLQNEPRHETGGYPSMRLEPADAAGLVKQLAPALQNAGLQTGLLGWDHNWDDTSYPLALLGDQGARDALAGTAFHCYGGDVSAQSKIRDAYPDKDVYFTECSGGGWATNWGNNLAWNVQHLVIGATRNWARTVLLWNLALDPQGGPTNGGCSNCRGVVTVDPASGGVTLNEEYYALGHAARFVRPGAVRIASASYGAGNIQTVAFRNPDGTRALIVLNGSSSNRKVQVVENGAGFTYTLPAGAVATITWPAS